MSKKIILKIKKDGTIDAETKGIKGKKCEDYIKIIEELTESKAINVEYTQEYYENTNEITENQSNKELNLTR